MELSTEVAKACAFSNNVLGVQKSTNDSSANLALLGGYNKRFLLRNEWKVDFLYVLGIQAQMTRCLWFVSTPSSSSKSKNYQGLLWLENIILTLEFMI